MSWWLFASLLAHAGDFDGVWAAQPVADTEQAGCVERRLWELRTDKVTMGLERRCEAPGVVQTCTVWMEPAASLLNDELIVDAEALALGQVDTHRDDVRERRGDTLSRSASSSQRCVLHATRGSWLLVRDGAGLVLTGVNDAPTWSLTREAT